MCARRQTITARESHTQCHLILQLILFTDLFAKKKHRGAREKKSDTHFFSVIQNYPRVGTTRNYLNSHISTLKKGTSLSINSAICFFVAALNNSKWLIQLKLKQNGWTSSSRRIAQWKIIYRRSANGIKKIVIQKNVFFFNYNGEGEPKLWAKPHENILKILRNDSSKNDEQKISILWTHKQSHLSRNIHNATARIHCSRFPLSLCSLIESLLLASDVSALPVKIF